MEFRRVLFRSCRGRAIFCSGSVISSCHWASHPAVRGMANRTVKISAHFAGNLMYHRSERVRGKGIHSMSLKINIRETADATILDISGRVSLGDGLADLRDSIREALAGDQKNILLNLAEVRSEERRVGK